MIYGNPSRLADAMRHMGVVWFLDSAWSGAVSVDRRSTHARVGNPRRDSLDTWWCQGLFEAAPRRPSMQHWLPAVTSYSVLMPVLPQSDARLNQVALVCSCRRLQVPGLKGPSVALPASREIFIQAGREEERPGDQSSLNFDTAESSDVHAVPFSPTREDPNCR